MNITEQKGKCVRRGSNETVDEGSGSEDAVSEDSDAPFIGRVAEKVVLSLKDSPLPPPRICPGLSGKPKTLLKSMLKKQVVRVWQAVKKDLKITKQVKKQEKVLKILKSELKEAKRVFGRLFQRQQDIKYYAMRAPDPVNGGGLLTSHT